MSKLEEVFNRIKDLKKEQKEIKSVYRDALSTSKEYQDISDKVKDLRERKKQIEVDIRSQFASEFNKLDAIKLDIQTDNELLSDLAINSLMKGETVKITDEYENDYEPIFNVRFKKAN